MPVTIVKLTGDLFFVEIINLMGKGKNIYVFKFMPRRDVTKSRVKKWANSWASLPRRKWLRILSS